MRLADFLRTNTGPILGEWDKFAKHIYPSEILHAAGLRDHAFGMLDVIASDLTCFQSELQQQEKSRGMGPHALQSTEAELHGSSRFAEGFDVNQMMAEFRALRACVLRLWGESGEMSPMVAEDITRFNEAIDQAMAESLACFTGLKDRQTRLFDALLSSSPDLNYIIEPDGKILYSNKAFNQFFRKTSGELARANFLSLCATFDSDIGTRIDQVIARRKTYRAEMCAVHGEGDGRSFEFLLVPVLDQTGRCEAIAGSARDITERKASEERILRSANHDSLTDLPNRNLFRERLQHEIKRYSRTRLPLGILFIDLDGFKDVNDLFGHSAGDQLLQQVAMRMNARVRDTDTVARLGGDEFGVILTDVTDPIQIDTIATQIIRELHRTFTLAAGEATISASMGVAIYPGDGETPDELISKADIAMYESKNAGRNQYRRVKTALPPGAGSS